MASAYHNLRNVHKWIGVGACLFLAVLSLTGFLLAIKGQVDWIRPANSKGTAVEEYDEVIGPDQAMQAAFAKELSGLATPADVDRLEYRVKDNIYKVLSKENYHEVQVDGSTGEVLSVGFRGDQLAEDIHDFSFFADFAHAWLLPGVAIGLFVLSISGVIMFLVPVIRRRRHKRSQHTKQ
ncbi:PepSY-associated TM helix domain-containing protein [Kamptonema cortianum]|nr:PepSY-associated TM helix domain-containing protein [Geitlerinema splendidum]MDK3155231.1 PepSY-associated TM helix domain-containing protein [Kamptonema cortianum]